MKLSLRCEYGLRALISLGLRHDERVVTIHAISERQDMPERFLAQILGDLRAGGFLESKLGKVGGYRLGKPPEEITLASVIRHLDGKLGPVETPEAKSSSRRLPSESDGAIKAINGAMEEAMEAVVTILDKVTLADLCDRARQINDKIINLNDYTI